MFQKTLHIDADRDKLQLDLAGQIEGDCIFYIYFHIFYHVSASCLSCPVLDWSSPIEVDGIDWASTDA